MRTTVGIYAVVELAAQLLNKERMMPCYSSATLLTSSHNCSNTYVVYSCGKVLDIMKFKEWFQNKLTVGSFPFMNNEHLNAFDYDYIINVSDEFYHEHHLPLSVAGCKTFWFPMNECRKDVGLNSIYGAMCILWLAEKENKHVYLHCHAGVNRSRCVQAAYFFMRNGQQLEVDTNGYINRLVAMCGRGYLPPKTEMEKFLTELGKQLESKNMMGGLLDHIKVDTINNF